MRSPKANNELLMRNNALRPAGSAAVPESHKLEHDVSKESNYAYNDRRPHGKGRGGYKGRNGRDNHPYDRRTGNHNNRGRSSSNGRGQGNNNRGRGGITKPSYSTISRPNQFSHGNLVHKVQGRDHGTFKSISEDEVA